MWYKMSFIGPPASVCSWVISCILLIPLSHLLNGRFDMPKFVKKALKSIYSFATDLTPSAVAVHSGVFTSAHLQTSVWPRVKANKCLSQ